MHFFLCWSKKLTRQGCDRWACWCPTWVISSFISGYYSTWPQWETFHLDWTYTVAGQFNTLFHSFLPSHGKGRQSRRLGTNPERPISHWLESAVLKRRQTLKPECLSAALWNQSALAQCPDLLSTSQVILGKSPNNSIPQFPSTK